MKNCLCAAIFVCAFAVISPQAAFGQWDYNQSAIDNIIESRIDRRKTRERIKARKGGRTADKKKNAAGGNRTSSAKNTSAATPPYVSFLRDSYQDFHLDDSRGYVVNFIFTSLSGKAIPKSYNYSYHNGLAEFGGIPAGVYTVKADAVYSGKKYAVHLGSRDGSSANPNGGDFAPSIKIQVTAAPDGYGLTLMKTFPETLYVRVTE